MLALLERVRSVNWLTLIGTVLWARLPEASRDALLADFDAVGVGGCVMVCVPAFPDVTSRELPVAYATVDALIRSIRLESVVESYAGESRGLAAWLRRFEAVAPST